jgi:sugar phosphate isomerase/epimerase
MARPFHKGPIARHLDAYVGRLRANHNSELVTNTVTGIGVVLILASKGSHILATGQGWSELAVYMVALRVNLTSVTQASKTLTSVNRFYPQVARYFRFLQDMEGLPAGGPNDEVPNWITAPWPPEHADALEYQWEVAVDYWADVADHAEEHGVDVGIEMHPNMLVYEPWGLLELREETGDRIGANFDPSHLYWQGIDVTEAIRLLGEEDAIHHFHAKDTAVYEANAREKGVLDTAPYTDEPNRSWLFRSIGYGHGEAHWKDVVSTLRMVGYDGALSIEHEDSLTSANEGLEKAVDVLSRAVFETQPGEAYWA